MNLKDILFDVYEIYKLLLHDPHLLMMRLRDGKEVMNLLNYDRKWK